VKRRWSFDIVLGGEIELDGPMDYMEARRAAKEHVFKRAEAQLKTETLPGYVRPPSTVEGALRLTWIDDEMEAD